MDRRCGGLHRAGARLTIASSKGLPGCLSSPSGGGGWECGALAAGGACQHRLLEFTVDVRACAGTRAARSAEEVKCLACPCGALLPQEVHGELGDQAVLQQELPDSLCRRRSGRRPVGGVAVVIGPGRAAGLDAVFEDVIELVRMLVATLARECGHMTNIFAEAPLARRPSRGGSS